MASNVIHGRNGILYLSTSTGSTDYGAELGYVDEFSIEMERDLAEVTKINQESAEYVEGLISGSLSASGHYRVGDTVAHKMFNRFMKTEIDSTGGTQTPIKSGSLYFHGIFRDIDTAKTSDASRGAKVVAELLNGNFSFTVGSGDVEGWSYGGNVNGDLLYVESTSTDRGIPKKA
jgi:hypothetical protein